MGAPRQEDLMQGYYDEFRELTGSPWQSVALMSIKERRRFEAWVLQREAT